MLSIAQVCMYLAFFATVLSIGALLIGDIQGRRAGKTATRVGYYTVFATAGVLTVSVVILAIAFFTKDFTFEYVAQNMPSDVSSLAWLYKLSGVWASQAGSLLFWAWLISLFNAWVGYRRFKIADRLSNVALMISGGVLAFFIMVMLFSSGNNPFLATDPGLIDASGNLVGQAAAWGMNPLLQHWAMTIHPPTLFIGYAGLTIPFAFAIAALIVNDSSKLWVEITHRITLFSWFFLGLGIGLGAVWAYVVLGWGGYWAWDPVENASLLPWLVGVALIHSMTVYRRREGFKKWTIFAACLTFAAVIIGTFITRSGIAAIQSVHTFGGDNVSKYVFLFLAIIPLIMCGIGLAIRTREFSSRDEFESFSSKDAAYYVNNVVMILSAILVFMFTLVLPLMGKTPAGSMYNLLAAPIGIAYCGIMAVCPLLAWKKTDGKEFLHRIKWPGIVALGLFAILMVEFVVNLNSNLQKTMEKGGTAAQNVLDRSFGSPILYNIIAILGLLVGCLLLCTTLSLFVRGVRARREVKGESIPVALKNVLFKSRSQSGGYLTHLGMAVILIGLVGSSMYVYETTDTISIKKGETYDISNYTLKYDEMINKTLPNGNQISGLKFDILRDGKNVGTAEPSQESYAKQNQTRLNASVVSEPLRDIFLVLNQVDPTTETANITVKINPLISWVWVGFGVLSLGTLLSMWPKIGAPEPVPATPFAPKKKKGRR